MNLNTTKFDTAFRRAQDAVKVRETRRARLASWDPVQTPAVLHEHPDFLRNRRAEVEKQSAEAIADLKQKFREALAAFRQDVTEQTVPTGDNLHAKARNDLELLDRELIASPEELVLIRKRYTATLNPAMLRAIEKYAAQRGWEGFEFEVDAGRYRAAADRLEQLTTEVFASLDSPAEALIRQFEDADKFIEYAVEKEA